jgi:hypothetical protein
VLGPEDRPRAADGDRDDRDAGSGGDDERAHVEGPQPRGVVVSPGVARELDRLRHANQ